MSQLQRKAKLGYGFHNQSMISLESQILLDILDFGLYLESVSPFKCSLRCFGVQKIWFQFL